MKVDTNIKVVVSAKPNERQVQVVTRGLKIKTGIKSGPCAGACRS
jgi:hypothetical protein